MKWNCTSIILWLCLCSWLTSHAQLQLNVNPSQTSGVAPLYIFFDATGTIGLEGTNDLVNADFSWNFDVTDVDPNGDWEVTKGMVAAHVFETPGLYTVECTVTSPSGTITTNTLTVNVTAFAGTTYYVAASGSDTNDGLSEVTPWQTANFALSQLSANERILFRRGDTFNNVDYNLQNLTGGKMILGAYGTGANPILSGTTDETILQLDFVEDIAIMDLHLQANISQANEDYFIIRDCSDVLLLNLELENPTSRSIFFNRCDKMGVFDTYFHDFGVMGCYSGDGTRFGWVGNTMDNLIGTPQPEHGIRLQGGEKQFIAHNDLTNLIDTKTAMTIRGDGQRHVMIYANKMDRLLGVNPQNTATTAAISQVTIEANYIGQNPNYTGSNFENSFRGINIEATNVAIRNNVIDGYRNAIGVRDRGNAPNGSGNVDIYNNTINWRPISPISNTGGRIVAVENAFNVNVINNLITAPTLAQAIAVDEVGMMNTNIQSNTNLIATPTEYATNPLPGSAADENDITNYQLAATSAAINAGEDTIPVFYDAAFVARSSNGQKDIGAFEYSEPVVSSNPIQFLNDEFNDPQSLCNWKNINETEGWNIQQLELYDINTSAPDKLRMMPYTASWFEDYRGPLLYKEVSGDFIFTTKVDVSGRTAPIPDGNFNFNLAGVMCRVPRDYPNGALGADGWQAGDQDYIFLSIGAADDGSGLCDPSPNPCLAPHLEVKTTDDSNSTLDIEDINTTSAQLRFARIGQVFIVMYRLETDQQWVVHRRFERIDFPETVQIGFVTYTNYRKVETYTPAFHNSNTLNDQLNPDPSSNPNLPFFPDLVGDFEFARFDELQVPTEFQGSDFDNPNSISNTELLSFLGYTSESYCPDFLQVQATIDEDCFVAIQADQELRLSNTISANANVEVQSQNLIIAEEGFHVEKGAYFRASIAPCNGGSLPPIGGEGRAMADQTPSTIDDASLNIYPNPATSETQVDFQLIEKSTVNLVLLNRNGQVLYSKQFGELDAGKYQESLSVAQFPTGVYLLSMQLKDKMISKKLVRTR